MAILWIAVGEPGIRESASRLPKSESNGMIGCGAGISQYNCGGFARSGTRICTGVGAGDDSELAAAAATRRRFLRRILGFDFGFGGAILEMRNRLLAMSVCVNLKLCAVNAESWSVSAIHRPPDGCPG